MGEDVSRAHQCRRHASHIGQAQVADMQREIGVPARGKAGRRARSAGNGCARPGTGPRRPGRVRRPSTRPGPRAHGMSRGIPRAGRCGRRPHPRAGRRAASAADGRTGHAGARPVTPGRAQGRNGLRATPPRWCAMTPVVGALRDLPRSGPIGPPPGVWAPLSAGTRGPGEAPFCPNRYHACSSGDTLNG